MKGDTLQKKEKSFYCFGVLRKERIFQNKK